MKIIDFHGHLMASDPEGEILIREMDKNHVEKTILLAVPQYLLKHHYGCNEETAGVVAKWPDRLIGGVYVDPRAVEQAQYTILKYKEKGFKVVKMFPALGFYPDDPFLFPVFELISKLKMAVLFHMGGGNLSIPEDLPIKPHFSMKYGEARYIDGLSVALPELNIVLAHMGTPTHKEAAILGYIRENVYFDCSSSAAVPALRELKAQGPITLRDAVQAERVNFDRVVWGLDGDARMYAERIGWWTKLLPELNWQEHSQKILWQNAEELLKKLE